MNAGKSKIQYLREAIFDKEIKYNDKKNINFLCYYNGLPFGSLSDAELIILKVE